MKCFPYRPQKSSTSKSTSSTSSKEPHKKADRKWSNSGSAKDQTELDYSNNTTSDDHANNDKDLEVNVIA